MNEKRFQGVVKGHNTRKNYGTLFGIKDRITYSFNLTDIEFHKSPGYIEVHGETIRNGQIVEFTPTKSEKGPVAKCITVQDIDVDKLLERMIAKEEEKIREEIKEIEKLRLGEEKLKERKMIKQYQQEIQREKVKIKKQKNFENRNRKVLRDKSLRMEKQLSKLKELKQEQRPTSLASNTNSTYSKLLIPRFDKATLVQFGFCKPFSYYKVDNDPICSGPVIKYSICESCRTPFYNNVPQKCSCND